MRNVIRHHKKLGLLRNAGFQKVLATGFDHWSFAQQQLMQRDRHHHDVTFERHFRRHQLMKRRLHLLLSQVLQLSRIPNRFQSALAQQLNQGFLTSCRWQQESLLRHHDVPYLAQVLQGEQSHQHVRVLLLALQVWLTLILFQHLLAHVRTHRVRYQVQVHRHPCLLLGSQAQ